jgi:hypothetical protein
MRFFGKDFLKKHIFGRFFFTVLAEKWTRNKLSDKDEDMDINIGTFMDMGTGHGHGYHAVKDSEMTWTYSTVNFLEE